MKKAFHLVLVLLFAVMAFFAVPDVMDLVHAAPEIGPYDLVVSPDGNDGNAGTLASPLKTVKAAKDKLKEQKETIPDGTRVCVYLRGGRYEFDEVLTFTEEDVSNVSYVAYDKEEVVFSGAKAISGFTEETANGVRVFTKTLNPGTDITDFKSLFSQTEQLPVPRYPESGYFTVKKLDPDSDLWTEETTKWDLTLGQRSFFADPADLKTDFTNYKDVQVRILHYWHDELMYLTDFNRATGRIGLSRPSSMKIRNIDRYYFENVFEALNEPGEWYLNRATNKLYYVPKTGETADTLVLYASNQELLVDINGVDGLTFEGIRFTQTDWNVPSPLNTDWDASWRIEYDIDALQAAYDVRGVVTARYADDLNFVGCEFIDLGADAVKLLYGVQNSSIKNCLFRNIAATAVYAGAKNCERDDPDCVKNITVSNCDISGYGRKFFCAIGIHITYCDGAELSHNEISDGYYTGISVGWEWGYNYHLTRNIKITDNLIYNIGQGWLSDMGGIYMLGMQPGTVLSGNVIHNVAADPGEGGYGGWGIYLDEGSSRMLVEKNLVYNCGSQSYNIHYGEGNIIRNNIGAFSAEGQVSVGSRGDETHATAFYYDNIFVSRNDEPIFVYMSNTSHFHENGNLFWDLTKGKKVYFALDEGKNLLTLSEAKSQGFIHNPTVADPLFKDVENYDFTLSEDSPALELNFQPWDYSVAGTIQGTTIGFSLQGGQTAYNSHVSAVYTTKKFTFGPQKVLRIILLTLISLVLAFWIVYLLVKVKNTSAWALLSAVVCLFAGFIVYFFFVHWNPALYIVGMILVGLSITSVPVIRCLVKKDSLKKTLVTAAIWLAATLAVLFGLALLLNNALVLGEALAILCVLTAAAVTMIVNTVLLVLVDVKKKD
ncbi:MAG: right-handed parallel beta-helix repeat-containing protein [Clostridia bacterium]|nr:right-handed parallel beta-helix repeat-containing protein [Clostridia bacterium]